ncbi:MAG: glucose-6-phosphate 1-dehydrogenase [Patiriisocius sp.]|jgi:glucose-6-phosphate 1-dehydrogenase
MEHPTQIVILGGSGDLAKRKLIPALLDLYVHKKLPEVFSIIGLARTQRTDQEYQQFVAYSITEHEHGHTMEDIQSFCAHVSYVSGSFDDTESYATLKQSLDTFAQQHNGCTNRLFYLAVPPQYYETIFENIHQSKLTEDCSNGEGWARILVEKPFGHDLMTAQSLDAKLSSLFSEDQIFRIDHYLAKEAVQNILSFRFANTLMRSPWNNEHIKEVRITMHEEVDLEERGSFYDGIGALRDVGQNHLLQLLALIAMDEPSTFTAESIRENRAAILQKLVPFTDQTIQTQLKRAQYEGYTLTKGVAENSTTETFFALTAFVDTDAWRGVPFHIEAGKGMAKKGVSIEITFKDVATGLFETSSCHTTENKVLLTISPEQAMGITLNAKMPGHGYQMESRTLSFDCSNSTEEISAYEKVLLDCISGDQTLFTQTKEVLASWTFISSILEQWEAVPLQTYPKGSEHPVQ